MPEYFAGGHLRYQQGAWRDDNGDPVDIAHVVRCKDCKHYEENPYSKYGKQKSCFVHILTPHPMPEDAFCSYGERRADNG